MIRVDIRKKNKVKQPFHDGGRYHIETSPLISGANQWTGFYMITASVLKKLILANPELFIELNLLNIY